MISEGKPTDRTAGVIWVLGVALLMLFAVRLVVAAPVALRFRQAGALRFDLAFCLALLLPASACLPRVRRFLARARIVHPSGAYLTALATPPALVLGWAPGRIASSLALVAALAIALAGASGLATRQLGGRAAGVRAAWFILSAFVLAAAWQCGAAPWLAWIRVEVVGLY